MPECSADDCANPQNAGGYCDMHYKRLRTTGTLDRNRDFIDWPPVIARAREIVSSYTIKVTLRQLFYRLVSEQLIENKPGHYHRLSALTAELRRQGRFPALYEHGRDIRRYAYSKNPAHALNETAQTYRIDRTTGQETTLVLGVEKNALGGLLLEWFGDAGLPIVPLGGYGSETLERQVRGLVRSSCRPAVFIYAGDFDASGIAIGRDFTEHTADCWIATARVALNENQVFDMSLPVLQGKTGDSRAPDFIAEFPRIHAVAGFGAGVPVQVELDAVEPNALRQMFQDEIDQWWDAGAYAAALRTEKRQRAKLRKIARDYDERE